MNDFPEELQGGGWLHITNANTYVHPLTGRLVVFAVAKEDGEPHPVLWGDITTEFAVNHQPAP